jgi:hypothetical protein
MDLSIEKAVEFLAQHGNADEVKAANAQLAHMRRHRPASAYVSFMLIVLAAIIISNILWPDDSRQYKLEEIRAQFDNRGAILSTSASRLQAEMMVNQVAGEEGRFRALHSTGRVPDDIVLKIVQGAEPSFSNLMFYATEVIQDQRNRQGHLTERETPVGLVGAIAGAVHTRAKPLEDDIKKQAVAAYAAYKAGDFTGTLAALRACERSAHSGLKLHELKKMSRLIRTVCGGWITRIAKTPEIALERLGF